MATTTALIYITAGEGPTHCPKTLAAPFTSGMIPLPELKESTHHETCG
ncbi:MAG: hypothetical protein HZA88_00025 [Verrucomicrobia bacterium]|nr:hypothetical protein [Verrucomicrobiota bacterium]